jgi:type I restriction enzyme S subunit
VRLVNEDFSSQPLGDLVTIIGGGTPSKSNKEYWTEDASKGIAWLAPADLKGQNTKKTPKNSQFITDEGLNGSSTKLLSAGDVLFSARGTVGLVALISDPVAFSQSFYAFRPDADKITSEYLFYFLLSQREFFQQRSTGSTFGSLNTSSIKTIQVPVPDLETQKKITSILSALDDRIEHNNNLARLLEENAQALYQSWFVRFDPVRAKERGEVPKGINPDQPMEKELADLFPDKIDSDTGLPEGWGEKKLKDIGKVVTGKTPSSKNQKKYWGVEIPFITPSDISNGVHCNTKRSLSRVSLEKFDKILLPQDSICLTCIASIGKMCITHIPSITNQQINSIIVDNNQMSTHVLFMSIKSMIPELHRMAGGSVSPIINKSSLENLSVIVPPINIQNQFNCYFPLGLYRDIWKENQILTLLRDLLLPRLVSGKIDVGAAKEERLFRSSF